MTRNCRGPQPARRLSFDDARVTRLGRGWNKGLERCRASRFQPLLLCYERLDTPSFDMAKHRRRSRAFVSSQAAKAKTKREEVGAAASGAAAGAISYAGIARQAGASKE